MAALLAILCASGHARADEAPALEPWRTARLGLGLHVGAATGVGSVEPGMPLFGQLGVAPAFAMELSYRLHRNLSLAALTAVGIGVRTPAKCTDAVDGFACHSAQAYEFAVLARYHVPLGSRVEPFIGVGVGGGAYAEKANKPFEPPNKGGGGGFCLIGCVGAGGLDLARARNRFGPTGVLGAGVMWRISRRIAAGASVHAFIGAYVTGDVQDTLEGQEPGPVRDQAVAGGLHAVLLGTMSILVHLGS